MKGGENMKSLIKNRKAQSEIITTVLIILLVLAAIVIVWQVVKGYIDRTNRTSSGLVACTGYDLEIVEAVQHTATEAKETLIIKRGSGSPNSEITGWVLYKDGALVSGAVGTDNLGPGEQKTVSVPDGSFASGNKIKIAAKAGETLCGATLEVTATSAV